MRGPDGEAETAGARCFTVAANFILFERDDVRQHGGAHREGNNKAQAAGSSQILKWQRRPRR
jgi:hypothetical protein